jgi:hypothetical protein
MAKVSASAVSAAASEFLTFAHNAGWAVDFRDQVVTITKYFTPNSREEFVALDQEYYSVLSMVKARGGSMWGTDGSGVGGYSAMLHGCFQMNVSGVDKRFIAALHTLLHEV